MPDARNHSPGPMANDPTDADIEDALATCAQEQIRIPGTIQPIGALLGIDADSGRIEYASANSAEHLGHAPEALFRQLGRDVLGGELWHSLRGGLSATGSQNPRRHAGYLEEAPHKTVQVHAQGGTIIAEIEDTAAAGTMAPAEQSFLIEQMQACTHPAALMDKATALLRHVTGFARVTIYRFDSAWNGEIVAEDRRSDMDSLLGLRFPHWDIPAQAREVMAQIPLRLICDARQTPVPILAANAKSAPLDLTHAQIRGISPVHMEYLRNLGAEASMTLSIMREGRLWGFISFHHPKPKVLPPILRGTLTSTILPVFCLKLALTLEQEALHKTRQIDNLKFDIQRRLESGQPLEAHFEEIGQTVCAAVGAQGIAIQNGTRTYTYGSAPAPEALSAIHHSEDEAFPAEYASENLAETFPALKGKLGKVAGAFEIARTVDRRIIFFRDEIIEEVAWAGNPSKSIETFEGRQRIAPRASFSKYLTMSQGACAPWSEEDKHHARRFLPILSAAEQHALMQDFSRQQALMIDELNHRVRNILALIRSVSNQARRDGGSLASYSAALEARIHALAAAHEIGSGKAIAAVSVKSMLSLESAPFEASGTKRVRVTGPDIHVKAENAPIFALVLHELMTNAVKYGALSNARGRVDVQLAADAGTGAMALEWRETGGPPVKTPPRLGFGTTLIRQAVPYELGGTSDLEFGAMGLRASLGLPAEALHPAPATAEQSGAASPENHRAETVPGAASALVMIVEDSYIVATDLASDLMHLGFKQVEVFGQPEEALEFLELRPPQIAVLDHNLGAGVTSTPVALELKARGIPMVFVTGYGDQIALPPELRHVPVLTKPIAREMLRTFFAEHPLL